jgi:GNAT superfamily N-acetyltransferase
VLSRKTYSRIFTCMSTALTIREAKTEDLDSLLELYLHLTPSNVPFSSVLAENIFSRFLQYEGSTILLGEIANEMVSSCVLVVIPNLTRGGAPYALIENVVTHADHRCLGYGKLVLDAATERAWGFDCYKVMLMTGPKEIETLAFYEKAGFKQSKTGFQKRRAVASE